MHSLRCLDPLREMLALYIISLILNRMYLKVRLNYSKTSLVSRESNYTNMMSPVESQSISTIDSECM